MKFKLNVIITVVFILALLLLNGCGSISKVTGTLVGKMMTQKTATLSTTALQVYFQRNVYPKATGEISTTYFDDWREGENMVYINFLKREGVGFYTIDGTVNIDGEDVPHLANGFYGKWIDKNDTSPKRVKVTTSTGESAEFTVAPPPPISIKSVNGSREGAVVDVTKDLVLELESPNTTQDTEFKISLLGTVMGIRTFMDFGVFKYKDKITIPADMWKNSGSSMPPGSGENWIKIERFEVSPKSVAGVGASQAIGSSVDCFPVTVKGEIDKTIFGTVAKDGIRVSDDVKSKTGTMHYEFSKPNAFLGRPFSSGKKFAVASFTVRATKLQQSRTKTNTSQVGSMNVTTTTTTTRTFPVLPDAYWEDLVDELYRDFESVLKRNHNISLIPVEKVISAPSYDDLEPISDNVSVVEVEKSYKNTKNLIPTTLSAIIDNISTTFASDRIDARLLRELGVDGLISVTIDLEMPWEEFTLTPRMSIRISGEPNGYIAGPTIFLQGLVTGNGIPLEKAKMNAEHIMEVLPSIIRKDELMSALDTGLKQVHNAEMGKGYEELWSLK